MTNGIITVYHNVGLKHAIEYNEMPLANEQHLGEIAKYVGETTLSYTQGHYYQCLKSGTLSPTYSWENADSIGNLLPIEVWNRYNYEAWFFGGQGSGLNKGYSDANDFDCRIWYNKNNNLNKSNFSKGDIVVQGELSINIQTQDDLKGYEIFNIKSINDNNFGINQHIHIGGK